jgi:asparagine N-glycosylation enzyme membrane subunit Stt3
LSPHYTVLCAEALREAFLAPRSYSCVMSNMNQRFPSYCWSLIRSIRTRLKVLNANPYFLDYTSQHLRHYANHPEYHSPRAYGQIHCAKFSQHCESPSVVCKNPTGAASIRMVEKQLGRGVGALRSAVEDVEGSFLLRWRVNEEGSLSSYVPATARPTD